MLIRYRQCLVPGELRGIKKNFYDERWWTLFEYICVSPAVDLLDKCSRIVKSGVELERGISVTQRSLIKHSSGLEAKRLLTHFVCLISPALV